LSTDVNTTIDGMGGSLVKVGTGTLTFGGFAGNSYTGATTVEGGTLVVNTTIGASSHVSVNGSATLAGGGFVSTVSVASGGTLAPGGTGVAVSVLRTGDVSLAAAANFAVHTGVVAPTGAVLADSLAVTGTVAVGGANLSVSFVNGYTPQIGDSFTIIDNDGFADAVTGQFTQGTKITIGG